MTGIPAATVRYWMQCPWWKELKKEVQKHKQEELDQKLTGVIMSASVELQDRVENGNWVRDEKTGELVRVPMKSGELAKDGLGIPFDKRALIRGDPTSKIQRDNTNQSSEDLLKQLAETFQKIVHEAKPYTIEGERVNNDENDSD